MPDEAPVTMAVVFSLGVGSAMRQRLGEPRQRASTGFPSWPSGLDHNTDHNSNHNSSHKWMKFA